jgi:hypothetical protein
MDLTNLKTTLNTIKYSDNNFTDSFWRMIKEEIGIHHVYPEQHSYVKKKLTFEERHKKIS